MSSTARSSNYQSFLSKPRVFILSDISNEPDDAESLVRYLLYSNQFQTEGLVAVTSTWMKHKVCPQDMHKIIDAYECAVANLSAHAHPDCPYPSADSFRRLIKSGPATYGMSAVGEDIPLSEGSKLLLERLEQPLEQPLWVLCWGGTNVLAQVLHHVQQTRTAATAAALRAKLRVYAISDQDDTGAWIRARFPDVFYIASVHAWNQYGLAAWTGIAGDRYYGFDRGGPDFAKVTKEWIREHIQIGPLGRVYPDYMFIPEGDTPTFLYLVQNGLGVSEHPEYGSWGGRYGKTDVSTAGLAGGHYSDVTDSVVGREGRTHMSNHATVWRWRDAFQNDFAARIQWTLSPEVGSANHHPVVCVNGSVGLEPVRLECEAGGTVVLDTAGTYDPDEGDKLSYKWTHYREPSATQWWVEAEVAEVQVKKLDEAGTKVEITLPPPEKCCVDLISGEARKEGQLMHIILAVTDNGSPSLTSYRRVLIQSTNERLKGGRKGADAVGDAMEGFADKESS